MSYRNEVSGNLAAAEDAVTISPRFHKASRVSVQLAGTFTATVTFEVTLDGTNWVAIGLQASNAPNAVSSDTTGTAAGIWSGDVDNALKFRARASAFTSGPVEVTIVVLPR